VSPKPIQDEIMCVRMDGSTDQLVVAPVMTDLQAPGGGMSDAYPKYPKGNLDITGQYFLWTTNLSGGRIDAFMVKVPAQLLVRSGQQLEAGANPDPAEAPATSGAEPKTQPYGR
jgi:hypothetical protein